MSASSYARQFRAGSPTKATTLLLGLLFICSASSGCTSNAQHAPLTVAFAGMNFAPDSAGLAEMLRQTEGATGEEQKGNLRMFADGAVDPIARRKANYVLARLLQRQSSRKELEEAVKRFSEASQFKPLFELSETHIAESAGMLGDERLVRQALEAIANSKTAEKKAKMAALYGLGQSHLRAGERDKAKQYFEQIAVIDPQSQYALGSSYYLATLNLGGDGTATAGSTTLMSASSESKERAIEQFRNYLKGSPNGRFAEDIMLQLSNMPGFVLTREDHNLFANAQYANGHWQTALNEWRAAGNTSQWYKQGICLMRVGKSAEGKSMLTSGIRNYPNDDAVPEAALRLARMTNRQGAIEVWRLVLASGSRFGDVALYNLATRTNTTADALPYYKEIAAKYPSSTYASDATWWLAWADIQSGHGAQALPRLQTGATRYSDTRAGARFAYWIGKVQERAGHKDLAKAAYQRTAAMQPWNYYAYRAQSRLAALNGGTDEGWRTNPNRRVPWVQDTAQQWQWPEPPIELAKQEGETVSVLTELRQWDECLELVAKKDSAVRAFYLAKLDMPMQAINAAVTQLHGVPQKSELWELAYPLLHAHLISQEGPKKKVDPLLVQALIREESRYNAEAVSSSNALGLMQLLPGTAYGVAKRIGIKLNNKNDIHLPDNNIKLGTDYLGYVHQRYNGNSLFAVASYNGGPNAVARWTKTMPADTDVFVENIPFRETRDYVRKVFGSYWNYRSIYAAQR